MTGRELADLTGTPAAEGSLPLDATPFLNRVQELTGLRAALGRAVAGHGGLLLISGEGGIGKTRLVSELTVGAGPDAADPRAAARVVWGRCWDSGGAPSMWPWTSVLRELFSGLGPDGLRAQLGSGTPWLAPLVPEIRETLPELEAAPVPDSEQSRFVLFDALAGLLRRASAQQPLVIVLDDIHAADQLSLLALLFVARHASDMRVLLIGTYREAEAQAVPRIRGLFTKLVRAAERLPLAGLEAGEIGRLIEHRAGAGSDRDVAETLHRATGGNPFFADEILRTLRSEGRLEALREGSVLPLRAPMGVRALIEQRLEGLPERTVSVLRNAAVIGDWFSLATLAQVTGRPRRELLEALEPAIDATVIDLHRDDIASYQFVHDLIRETAYAGMRPLDRARAHAAVGAALERRYAGATERHLDELAYHFLESLPAGDPDLALDYAHRAADQAMAGFAHERAARLYSSALAALDLIEGGEHQQRCLRRSRLLAGLGRAQLRIADPRARDSLLDAAAAARTAGSASALAEAALAFGAFALTPGWVDTELTELLEEALGAVAPDDSGVRANLLARLARALYWSREGQQRRQLIDEAVAMARRLNDPDALALVLGNCIPASRGPDTAELELGWIYEVLSLNRTPGELLVLARSIEIDLLLERGALAAADTAIESLEAQAQRLRDIRARPYAALHRARRATMEGRWADAEALIAEVERTAGDLEDSTVPLIARGALFMLRIIQGNPEQLAEEVGRVAAALPQMDVWSAGLALVNAIAGQGGEAQRLLDRLAVEELGTIPRNNMWLITLGLLADVSVRLGDREHAAVLHRELLPFAGVTVISPVNGYMGPVARYLGLLETVIGDSAAAEADLRAALESARRQRTVPMIGWIALDLASVLSASEDPAAGAEVGRLLDEGEGIAQQLGLPALTERAAEIRGAPPRRPRRKPVHAVDLTRATLVREGEMWSFGFEGRTVRVRDSKGVRHLAELLSQPGVEVHAMHLVRSAGSGDVDRNGLVAASGADDLPSVDSGAGAGPALDDEAKAAYRRRLEDLRDELEEAERWSDPERAGKAREELDFLGRELAAAVGIGGRDRPQASDAERARVNVTRAIRTAIRRLAEQDLELGAELEATVRTGLFCRHQPNIRRPVRWEVDGG